MSDINKIQKCATCDFAVIGRELCVVCEGVKRVAELRETLRANGVSL